MPPKKGFKHTPETCKIYSESKKGIKNPMFGKHLSEDHKRKISEAEKGKVVSEETRRKISLNQTYRGHPIGYKMTQEAKDKISRARKGMVFSEEHLKNLSESHKGQIVTEEGKRKRSEYNKTHPEVTERLRHIKRPTKPQLKLFEEIKTRYPDNHVELEWRVETKDGYRFIDVAIPSLMLGFEWDEPVFHGIYWGNKEKDLDRHKLIESLGWKLVHYSNVSEFPKK